jgi:hypothetical protein
MNALYVLNALPASAVRNIWYYLGMGTRTACIIQRKIRTITRREKSGRWVETYTLWNIGRNFVGGMFDSWNSCGLKLSLWCELRILMTIVVKRNGIYLDTLPELYRRQVKIFRMENRSLTVC